MPLTPNGTGSLTGASIGANNVIQINGGTGVTTKAGDVVVAMMAQQTNLTASAATDNLGNTYTAFGTGTSNGGVSGRGFYTRVTVAGLLTSVIISASSSTNDFSCCAAVFNSGFDDAPLDVNAGLGVGDTTSPFACPATGTLSQALELVVCWSANNANGTWVGTSPLTTAVDAPRANAHSTIGYKDVISTTTTTPEFSSSTAPTGDVLGTVSFKQTVPMGQVML